MNLQDLNLNRYLYKETSSETSSNIADSSNNYSDFSGGNGGVPEPGSIITSVILQSSPSDNRIEINPDDTLKAYNGGEVVLIIDKDGIIVNNATIVYSNINEADIGVANIEKANIDKANITDGNIDTLIATDITTDTLDVTTTFIYAGYQQPQVFGGEVDSGGSFVNGPPGWIVSKTFTGTYFVIHALANTAVNYQVVVTAATGHFRGKIVAKISGSFVVTFQETVYGSDTFSVSGGGGGSVTVDGVRVSPFEELVDTAFDFVLVNNLP